jgi:hypothetical protein
VGKGSKRSAVIQKVVVAIWMLAARWAMHIDSLWIPGSVMLDTGVDRLSREDAVDKHDVRVKDGTWTRARAMAAEGGMRLTVDWFADPHNARTKHFWSRQIAAGAAGTDALSASSWGRVRCMTCNADHDRGAWVFPPIPLLPKTIGKLKADGAHGVALVPFRPDTPWWTALTQACKGQGSVEEVTVDQAFSTSNLAERSAMYSGSNWRLCRFNFGADPPFVYAEQCATPSKWIEPTASPAELGHQRRLHALLRFFEPDPRGGHTAEGAGN